MQRRSSYTLMVVHLEVHACKIERCNTSMAVGRMQRLKIDVIRTSSYTGYVAI